MARRRGRRRSPASAPRAARSPSRAWSPDGWASSPALALYLVPENPLALRLWRTDGTRAGTFPVSPPLTGADPTFAFALGHRLVFEACDGAGSCGVWVTDGSAAGTTLLKGSENFDPLAAGTSRAFFTNQDTRGGFLWMTDGTPKGTRQVLSLSYAQNLTVSGSRAFFLTGGDDYSAELWTTDGTAGGSRRLLTLARPSRGPAFTNFLKPVPGGIVWTEVPPNGSSLNLWRSDGTRAGTRRLTDFQGVTSLEGLQQNQIAAAGDRLFFVATDVSGPRLWSTWGTTTAPVTAPITGCPGGCPALEPDSPLVPLGNRVVFVARDLAHGAEPWTSDGTGAGIRILRDLCAGACDSNPEAFNAHRGTIDFQATWNGQTRLVRTDGLSAAPLAPLVPTTPSNPDNGDPPARVDLADVGPLTVFAGLDSQGPQPWVTDGTAPGGASGRWIPEGRPRHFLGRTSPSTFRDPRSSPSPAGSPTSSPIGGRTGWSSGGPTARPRAPPGSPSSTTRP
jgi:ELWxxDGT repeat protein